MWVRTEGPNVLRYHDGKFENVISAIGSSEVGVTAMARANDGGILIATLVHGVLRYSKRGHETLASSNDLHNFLILSLAETTDRKVWIGTRDNGLFYLSNGHAIAANEGLPDRKINCLLPTDDGRLWIGTDDGVALWDGARITDSSISAALGHVQVLTPGVGSRRKPVGGYAESVAQLQRPGHTFVEPTEPVIKRRSDCVARRSRKKPLDRNYARL